MKRLSHLERCALVFIIPANILYTVAALTHKWFEIPPCTFYGLWWVEFCDVLRCQLIPAFFTEEPLWYHLLQSVSIIAWSCLFLSMLMLLTSIFDRFLPSRRQTSVAGICLMSVFAISTTLVVFYTKLKEMSPDKIPEVSWAAILAAISCCCQLSAGLILLKTVDFKFC